MEQHMTDPVGLPGVEEIRILRLRPDDVLIATVNNAITDRETATIEARLRERFPDNEVVVTMGVQLQVGRRDDLPVTDQGDNT